MVRYYKAGTNIVGLPKEMVFIDKSNNPHLFPSLTPKKHIAIHYGHSAIETAYNPRGGNLLKITKGEYTDYTKKVQKVKKAAKALANATASAETAAKKIRKPRSKIGQEIDGAITYRMGAMNVPKRRGRAPLSDEIKAARAETKRLESEQKKINKAQKKIQISQQKKNQ